MKYKNIPRLYINKELKRDSILEISNKDKHHLYNVMRMKEGEPIKVFNGVDGEWEAIIHSTRESSIKCIKQIRKQEFYCGPSLYFAIIKSNNLKWMIEKVTELGVSRLIPVITERTNVKDINRAKIITYTKEASEVSERIELPTLENKITLNEMIVKITDEDNTLLFCNENRDDPFLHETLIQHKEKNISFLIGPEGGFSEKELIMLKSQKKIIPVKLNDRILRADTASVLAISAYNLFLNI